MYNLQVPGAGGMGGETSLATTPRTPEILNSLIAMTNPFEAAYRGANQHPHRAPRLASSPPGNSDNSTSSSGSGGCVSPPSVQHTCSQLIKEGLKLTIQSKRRQRTTTTGEGSEGGEGCEGGDERKMARRDEVRDDDDDSAGDGLTPEDEERRKRRRERNKIAATKCRLKKRERTVNLVQESEILENQNHDLKSQIQELETQRRRLVDMLSVHRPSCQKQLPVHPTPFPTTTYQTFSRPSSVMESGSSMFRRISANTPTYPRTKSTLEATASYHTIEMSSSSCVETPYQRIETVLEAGSYGRSDSVFGFDTEVKNGPTTMLDCAQGSPTFSQIGEQFPCQQNFTDLDRFVKPELPPFHGPAASYGRPPVYDSTATYQHYEEEADTFISTDFTSRSALPD